MPNRHSARLALLQPVKHQREQPLLQPSRTPIDGISGRDEQYGPLSSEGL